jgi:methyltransferase (TIGR00027 family)
MIDARPSRTALRVAIRRAAHQLVDRPVILHDPIAIPILGTETAAALRADPSRFEQSPLDRYLRAFVAVRSRFSEDKLDAARAAGVGQYVVLGAGLDTFGYRQPHPERPLRVWEIDHPATQAWKRQLLDAAGIAPPANLTYVPVDFERDSLAGALAGAGFDASAGAVFSWLGVTPYLTKAAIHATLGFVARVTDPSGGVSFDYSLSPSMLTEGQRAAFDAMSARVARAGEPFISTFEPDDLAADLRSLGFRRLEDVSGDQLNARYFADRADGLRVGNIGRMMWAS